MNERLSLQDLIDLLAKEQEITKKDAESFLRELFVVISESIENNEPVKIKDFGTFKLVKVSARKSVDVNTGDAIEIPSHYKLSFTPDKSLKEAINRPFAHFESVILEDGVSFDNIENNDLDENPEYVESATDDDQQDKDSDRNVLENKAEIEETISEIIPFIPQDIEPDVEKQQTITSNIEKEDEANDPVDTMSDNQKSIDKAEKDNDIKESTEDDQSKKGSKRRRKFITLGFFIFLILAGFFVGGLYFQEIANYLTYGPKDTRATVNTSDNNNTATESNTPTLLPDSIDKKEEPVSDVKQIKPAEPLGTEVIKSGHTLRNISLKYYGHKSFWIYIYQENKDAIKNPNNVPLGTKLVIPSPEKYGINAQNKESVEAAKNKEAQLIASMGL